jgi:hypothetical protein
MRGRGSSVTDDTAEPLPAIGNPGSGLSGQIARFGSLAGRELAARAAAARQASGTRDPRRDGGAQGCAPLSTGEQREMLALRAVITGADRTAAPAITGADRTAAPAGAGQPGQSGSPQIAHRPARLWRPAPLPDSRRAPARHRRTVDPDPR